MTNASTHDVREGGGWSWLQRFKNDAIYACATLLLLAARRASSAQLAAVGRWLGGALHALAWPLRVTARRNVALAFPTAAAHVRARIARNSFVNLGGHLGEVVASLHSTAPLLAFDEPSTLLLHEALAEGHGVILPSAHLGPWERLAATIAASFPFTAIVRESYDPRLDDLTMTVRQRGGVATIPRGAPSAPARIVRALRSGRVLGIPMDLRTRATSAVVPFLGAGSPTAVGPARLALRMGAPVIVSTIEIRDAGFTVTCTRVATDDLDADDDVQLTKRINHELDRRIRLAAEHWPWMHTRR